MQSIETQSRRAISVEFQHFQHHVRFARPKFEPPTAHQCHPSFKLKHSLQLLEVSIITYSSTSNFFEIFKKIVAEKFEVRTVQNFSIAYACKCSLFVE